MSLTAERLRKVLVYDPETGIFTRNGRKTGCVNAGGYVVIGVDGKLYFAHRLAWLYVHGEWPPEIDHINRSRADNRFCNLRDCDHTQNGQNTKRQSNNTSGFKGVSFCKRRKKWRANIQINGKYTQIGRYHTPAAAHAAYVKAACKHFGEFANSGELP